MNEFECVAEERDERISHTAKKFNCGKTHASI